LGGTVTLPAELATPFGLVLHELATNAIKFGSLSHDKGFVDLAWRVDPLSGVDILNFSWIESEGPAVIAPTRQGFGGQLLERGLPGAKVKREFLPAGFECRIEMSVSAESAKWN
jgi:two-component system CheB/CheR fusion protein